MLAIVMGTVGVLLACIVVALCKRAYPQLFRCKREGGGPDVTAGDVFRRPPGVAGTPAAGAGTTGMAWGHVGTLAVAGVVKEWTPRSPSRVWTTRLTSSGKVRSRTTWCDGLTAISLCERDRFVSNTHNSSCLTTVVPTLWVRGCPCPMLCVW
jgi:hypothetical protein